MTSTIGVLEWKDTDASGKSGWGDEEGVSPSISTTSSAVQRSD